MWLMIMMMMRMMMLMCDYKFFLFGNSWGNSMLMMIMMIYDYKFFLWEIPEAWGKSMFSKCIVL